MSRAFGLQPRLKIGEGVGGGREKKDYLGTSSERIHKFLALHFQVLAASWEKEKQRICATLTRLRQKSSLPCFAAAFANPAGGVSRNQLCAPSTSKAVVLILQLSPQQARSAWNFTLLLSCRTQPPATPPYSPALLISACNLSHFTPVKFPSCSKVKAHTARRKKIKG